jgi:hypothetical protein
VNKAGPFIFASNVALDMASVNNLTITPAPAGAVTITLTMGSVVTIAVNGGLNPNTQYTVTFPTTVTDTFQQPLPAAAAYSFTTGA